MDSEFVEASSEQYRYWLPDPLDVAPLLRMLETMGYQDRWMAIDEVVRLGEHNNLYEVVIVKREIVKF